MHITVYHADIPVFAAGCKMNGQIVFFNIMPHILFMFFPKTTPTFRRTAPLTAGSAPTPS